MIVDIDMHWHPESVFSDKSLLNAYIRSTKAAGQFVELRDIPGTKKQQMVVCQPEGVENLNLADVFVGVEDRLKAMDEAGVDKGILRICCFQQWMNLELLKRVNNLMADYIKQYPGRFLGTAAVPPWGDEESLDELKRCIYDLGFVAVLSASHYGTRYLDEKEFRKYFKAIDKLGVPILVHHTPLPLDCNSILKYGNLRRLYGRCQEQMTSTGRIIYSDLLEECPNLKIIPTQMAGAFFAYTSLMLPEESNIKEDVQRFDTEQGKIRKYLKNNIYFNITTPTGWSKNHLEFAVKELGAEHILFGTSYPVRREWLIKGVDHIRSLNISEQEKDLILGGNAQKLFNLKD